MNYRHAYHAGNFADVQKHAVLALIVEHLKRKDAPFRYVDTHAGIGAYDLASVQAEKTCEWQDGIGRVLAETAPPPELAPYLQAVEAVNPGGGVLHYPGSPAVVAALARPGDKLALCELHPEDATALRRRFRADARVGVHHMDGYTALKAMLPPPERRGLVLIDPPFEVRDEFTMIVALSLPGLSPIEGRAVTARFDGGELSSDAGVLALREIKSRLGVAERLAACLDDPRTPELTIHSPWQRSSAFAC